MVGLVFLPDGSGDALIQPKGGRMMLTRPDDPGRAVEFINIRPRMIAQSALEEGGDGGGIGDPYGLGQTADDLLGAILRIDVSQTPYAVPRDNPFANGDGRPEIYAYGFRNPLASDLRARARRPLDRRCWRARVGGS